MPDPSSPLSRKDAGDAVAAIAESLAGHAVDEFYAIHPKLKAAHEGGFEPVLRREALRMVEYIVSALRDTASPLYTNHVEPLAERILSAGGELAWLAKVTELIGQTIRERLGHPVWSRVQDVIDPVLLWLDAQPGGASSDALVLPGNVLSGEILPPALAHRYLQIVLQGNRIQAQKLVFDALEDGMTVRQIYLEVFQPALYEIGRLWEIGRVSIAQEHLASAITQSVLAALYARVEMPSSLERHAIVACLAGNYHEIGPRMLADFLQMAGYNTRFLGANTPLESLMAMIDRVKPDVVGLPATTTPQVNMVRRAIGRLRSDFTNNRPVIMAGGLAFNLETGLWRAVNADLWQMDAGRAVDQLVGSGEWC